MKKFNNFITIEGTEGSGKTTVIESIKKYFENKNQEVILTREPGGTGLEFCETIRETIFKYDGIKPITEFLLFTSSRKEHLDKLIIPSINNGKVVICDRFSDSSVVYQGMSQDVDLNEIERINEIIIGKNMPSLTILLDLDPKIGLERIGKNNREKNRFDDKDIEFHTSIRNNYLELAKKHDRIKIVDASKKPEEVFEQVKEILERYT